MSEVVALATYSFARENLINFKTFTVTRWQGDEIRRLFILGSFLIKAQVFEVTKKVIIWDKKLGWAIIFSKTRLVTLAALPVSRKV
jgi:hypothetical protein